MEFLIIFKYFLFIKKKYIKKNKKLSFKNIQFTKLYFLFILKWVFHEKIDEIISFPFIKEENKNIKKTKKREIFIKILEITL